MLSTRVVPLKLFYICKYIAEDVIIYICYVVYYIVNKPFWINALHDVKRSDDSNYRLYFFFNVIINIDSSINRQVKQWQVVAPYAIIMSLGTELISFITSAKNVTKSNSLETNRYQLKC